MQVRTLGALVLVLSVAGCGDSTSTSDAAPSDSKQGETVLHDGLNVEGAPGDGPRDGPGDSVPQDAPKGDAAIVTGLGCSNNQPFGATISKACSAPSDCVAVMHMRDCCGTMVSIGINKADKAAYDAAEKVCAAGWPACGCASQQTKTEDGSTLIGAAKAAATCVNGVCVSYIEQCNKPCGANQECFGCVDGPSTTFVCSTTCVMKSDCKTAQYPECAAGIGAQKFCYSAPNCNVP